MRIALNVLQHHNWWHAKNQQFYEREELPEIRGKYRVAVAQSCRSWLDASRCTYTGLTI